MALPQNKYSLSSLPQNKNRNNIGCTGRKSHAEAVSCPLPRNQRPAIFKAMCSDIGFVDLQKASLTFEQFPAEKVSNEPEGPYVKQALRAPRKARGGSEEGPGMTIT